MLYGHHTPQSAIDAPRFCISKNKPATMNIEETQIASTSYSFSLYGKILTDGRKTDSEVYVEEGLDAKVVDKLNAMGHRVVRVPASLMTMFGRSQVKLHEHWIIDPLTELCNR